MLPVIPLMEKSVKLGKDEFLIIPYRVGQENILLQMKDSKSKKDIYSVVLQLLRECVKSSTRDLSSLSMAEVDWLFLQLKNISSGSGLEIKFKCKNPIKGSDGVETPCGLEFDMEFDTEEIEILGDEPKTKFLMELQNQKMWFVFRKPTLQDEINFNPDMPSAEILAQYLESVTLSKDSGEDTTTMLSDYTQEQRIDYCKTIPSFLKIDITKNFFSARKRLNLSSTHRCECGQVHKATFQELMDFFV